MGGSGSESRAGPVSGGRLAVLLRGSRSESPSHCGSGLQVRDQVGVCLHVKIGILSCVAESASRLCVWGPSQGWAVVRGWSLPHGLRRGSEGPRAWERTGLSPGSRAGAGVRVRVWCPPCGSESRVGADDGGPGGRVGIRFPWRRSRAGVPVGDSSLRQGSVSGLGFGVASWRDWSCG